MKAGRAAPINAGMEFVELERLVTCLALAWLAFLGFYIAKYAEHFLPTHNIPQTI